MGCLLCFCYLHLPSVLSCDFSNICFSQLCLQPMFPLANLTHFLMLRILLLYLRTCALYASPHDLLAPHKCQSLNFETVIHEGGQSSLAHCCNGNRHRGSDEERKWGHLISPPTRCSIWGLPASQQPPLLHQSVWAWWECGEAMHLYRHGGALRKDGPPWWKT